MPLLRKRKSESNMTGTRKKSRGGEGDEEEQGRTNHGGPKTLRRSSSAEGTGSGSSSKNRRDIDKDVETPPAKAIAGDTSIPTLTYWDCQGRAEVARLIFIDAGREFNDKRLLRSSMTKWINIGVPASARGGDRGLKFDIEVAGPCCTLPMLKAKGVYINQTLAVAHFAAELCHGTRSMCEKAQEHMVSQLCFEELLSPLWKAVWGTVTFEQLLGSDPTEGILFQFGNLENIIKSNPSFTSKSPAPSSCSNSHSASDGDDALFVIGDRVGVADYFAMYTVASFIAVLGQTFQTVLAEVCPVLTQHYTFMRKRPRMNDYLSRRKGAPKPGGSGEYSALECPPVNLTGAPGEEAHMRKLRISFEETLNWQW